MNALYTPLSSMFWLFLRFLNVLGCIVNTATASTRHNERPENQICISAIWRTGRNCDEIGPRVGTLDVCVCGVSTPTDTECSVKPSSADPDRVWPCAGKECIHYPDSDLATKTRGDLMETLLEWVYHIYGEGKVIEIFSPVWAGFICLTHLAFQRVPRLMNARWKGHRHS